MSAQNPISQPDNPGPELARLVHYDLHPIFNMRPLVAGNHAVELMLGPQDTLKNAGSHMGAVYTRLF